MRKWLPESMLRVGGNAALGLTFSWKRNDAQMGNLLRNIHPWSQALEMSAATLIALPPIILTLLIQRRLVSGLSFGAVNG